MKIIKNFFKVIAAGIVSIIIISFILCFYNVVPVHEENKRGNTDYVYPPGSVWVKASEGISFGKFDDNGFNNKYVVDDPDIIILGSSHMEAMNVMPDQNTAALLAQKFKDKYSVYNMGVSRHDFFKVCQFLPANIELYDNPPKLVIIESKLVEISKSDADKVINASLEHIPSYNNGLIGIMQNIPFFRTLYQQMEWGLANRFMTDPGFDNNKNEDNLLSEEDKAKRNIEINYDAYSEIFEYLKEIEEKYNTRIIIFYHPSETLMDDGSIYFDSDKYLKAFSEYSDKYGISFIDMTDRFTDMYYNENHVPHGFCTGLTASGHINKYGHEAVADELYKTIIRMEESGEICQ